VTVEVWRPPAICAALSRYGRGGVIARGGALEPLAVIAAVTEVVLAYYDGML
jgi:hypothetical protein